MIEPVHIVDGIPPLPVGWIKVLDAPPMMGAHSAVTPDDALLVAASAILPTVLDDDPAETRAQGALLRVTLAGTLAWVKAYQPGMDNLFHAVDVNSIGQVFVAGHVTLPSRNGHFGWILKLDASGNPLWERRVGEDSLTTIFQVIVATSDEGAAAVGRFNEDPTLATGPRILAKFDADGNLEFAKVVQGIAGLQPVLVTETANGDLIVCLQSLTSQLVVNGGQILTGVVVCRFDSDGTLIWQQEFPDLLDPCGVVALPDGSVALGAHAPFIPVVMVLDPSGAVSSSNAIDARNDAGDQLPFRLTHLAGTSDQGLLATGSTFSTDATLLFRFDAALQPLWGRSMNVDARFDSVAKEMVLSTTTSYLLAIENARNLEQGIEGLLLARLDAHGDLGRNGCGLLSAVSVQTSSWTVRAQNSPLTFQDETPDVNTVSSTITQPAVASAQFCRHERQVRFDPPFLEPPVTICFDDLPMPDPMPAPLPGSRRAGLPGSLPRKRSCNDDPGCLRCLKRLEDGAAVGNPGWRAEFYRALRPFARVAEGRVPVEAADTLRSALSKVPAGGLFDDEVRADLRARIGQWRKARARKGNAYIPRAVELSPHLARAANLIDLDLLLPQRIMIEMVEDGLVVKGLLKLRQAPRALSGARVRVASDAPGPLPPRMMPGWPSLLWQLKPSDNRLDYVIELSYGGMRFDSPESALRLVQWHGRTVRDTTVQVDRDRRVVIGHASGPGTFGILAHLARG